MQFAEYQAQARATAVYPDAGNNFVYPTLGLVGEAGECADKIKKLIRDQHISQPSAVSDADRAELLKELGDVLWYTAQLASEFDASLDGVAQMNLDKLRDRAARNSLSGSGDNR